VTRSAIRGFLRRAVGGRLQLVDRHRLIINDSSLLGALDQMDDQVDRLAVQDSHDGR
jgi:hypothetical protein